VFQSVEELCQRTVKFFEDVELEKPFVYILPKCETKKRKWSKVKAEQRLDLFAEKKEEIKADPDALKRSGRLRAAYRQLMCDE
jgi:hypothetical protein